MILLKQSEKSTAGADACVLSHIRKKRLTDMPHRPHLNLMRPKLGRFKAEESFAGGVFSQGSPVLFAGFLMVTICECDSCPTARRLDSKAEDSNCVSEDFLRNESIDIIRFLFTIHILFDLISQLTTTGDGICEGSLPHRP